MKVTIVNAYGRSNRGDSVLLDECINEIKNKVFEAEISGAVYEGIADINKIHPDIFWSERIGNNSYGGILGRIITLFYVFISIISTIKIFEKLHLILPINQRKTFNNIRQADILISAPGGYIHDTNFAYFIALLHIWLGSRFQAKVILAPQSIGPIDKDFSKFFARKTFEKCDVICARESYTYNFLINDIKLSRDIVFQTGDSAFWNFFVNNNKDMIDDVFMSIGFPIESQQPILGITVVNWSFPKSQNPIHDANKYASGMAKIIDDMFQKYGCIPVIFNQVSEDLPMAEKVASLTKTKVYIDKCSREPEILRAMIARSTIFLGTRFHSCIFSMMAHRPTFAISYLPKTSYILKDLKLSDRQTSIENLDINLIIQTLENDLKDIKIAEQKIKSSVETYRNNFSQLRDFL